MTFFIFIFTHTVFLAQINGQHHKMDFVCSFATTIMFFSGQYCDSHWHILCFCTFTIRASLCYPNHFDGCALFIYIVYGKCILELGKLAICLFALVSCAICTFYFYFFTTYFCVFFCFI